jgi:hypothetical protein
MRKNRFIKALTYKQVCFKYRFGKRFGLKYIDEYCRINRKRVKRKVIYTPHKHVYFQSFIGRLEHHMFKENE